MADRRRRASSFGTARKLPSGRYQVRYYDRLGRRQTAPTTFATKADATTYLATVQADLHRDQWVDPRLGRMSFREWVHRWQKTTTHLRPKTRNLYDYLLDRLILPTFGDAPLSSIDTLAVRVWLAAVHAIPGVGPTTIAKAYRLLSRILKTAVESGYIRRNPCAIKGAGVEHAPEITVATIQQVATLAELVGRRYRALVLVGAFSGLRWGEVIGLRRHRVNPDGSIKVTEQITELRGYLDVAPVKTKAGERVVALPKLAADALLDHLRLWSDRDPNALVFTAPKGGPLRSSNFRTRVWLDAVAAAGMVGFRFHDLRHTAATLAIAAGASTKELMGRIGHASPAAALRYQHAMEGRDAAIALGLDRLIKVSEREAKKRAKNPEGTQRARGQRGKGRRKDA